LRTREDRPLQYRTIEVGGYNALFVTAYDELSQTPTQILNGNNRMNPGESIGVLVNIDADGFAKISWSTINADTRANSGSGVTQAGPGDVVLVN
jgi:hypothetical protein